VTSREIPCLRHAARWAVERAAAAEVQVVDDVCAFVAVCVVVAAAGVASCIQT
jgi:hypothetical protein